MPDRSFFFTSELPEKVLHSLITNEVGCAHHGHGHEQAEDEKGEAPLGQKGIRQASGRGRGRGWVGPHAFVVEDSDEDEAEREETES